MRDASQSDCRTFYRVQGVLPGDQTRQSAVHVFPNSSSADALTLPPGRPGTHVPGSQLPAVPAQRQDSKLIIPSSELKTKE